MSTLAFEELDYRATPAGALSLRRRREPLLGGVEVYEIKLDDAFLMSSLFHRSETALAELALGAPRAGPLDVVVGGLGLGYTAAAVLAQRAVRSLTVIELHAPVIEWHERGLVPHGATLTGDPRCRLVHGDFFALARSATGFDAHAPGRRFDAVLVDIDHSPRELLDPANAPFYEPTGLAVLAGHLHAGGAFALWSNDPPDDAFTRTLAAVFADVDAHVVTFPNPYQGNEASSTVYVARTAGADR